MRNLEKGPPMADADGWFTPGRFAGILAGLIFVCFPLVVLGVETFFFRDFGSFGYPLAFYHRESFWRGEMPLWNPYNSCGLPFLAQWNTLTLYPLSLFYLLLPLSWSLGMFCLGHLFLGGIGMYFLAQRWTGNRLAAAVAGTVFAFNGLTWNALMWPNNIAALGWMPWVVLACERAWREGGRRVIVASVIGALQMLAGAPEIIFLTWGLTGTFWLVELWRETAQRRRFVARFFFVICLVAGMAAAQLLPFLDLLAHSQRSASFGGAQEWAMPIYGFANFFAPLFHLIDYGDAYAQDQQFWIVSYYLGAGTITLALLACWRARNWRTWLLAGATILSLWLTLGTRGGLYAVVRAAFPFIGFMRYPIKFIVVATFAIPLLAAEAISGFQALPETQWTVERKRALALGAGVLAVIAVIGIVEWLHPQPKDNPTAVVTNAAVRGIFLALTIGMLIVLRRVPELKLQRLLRVCLIMLFWFDIYTHAPNLNPTVDRAIFETDSIRDFFKWNQELRPGVSRAFEAREAATFVQFHKSFDAKADVLGRRLSLFANYNLLDHASKLDGEYSLDMREMNELWLHIFLATNDFPRLEDFLGVAIASNPTNAVHWVSRNTFLPMITGGQEPVFEDDETTRREITSAGFEPSRTVYVEPAALGQIAAKRADVKISPKRFEARTVEAEVDANAPAMVVIAQAFYHRWHAYVDGKPARLWRANYAFQALETPAGKHEIKLVYEDAAFNLGVMISLGSLVIAGAVWFLAGKRRVND